MSGKKLENQILWVILILTLFALFVVTFETFKFDIDRVSLLIATFGAIGAVAAAVAAARSANIAKVAIDAQKKQFEKSIEPYLVPIMNKFTVYGDATSIEIVVARWDKKDHRIEFNEDLEIPLINVASGVAKNVVVDFEINNYKDIVHNYEKNSSSAEREILKLTLSEEDDKSKSDRVTMNINLGGYNSVNLLVASNFKKQEFPFIHKDMHEQMKIDVPELFIVLNNLSLYDAFTGHRKSNPELILNITCQDLADKEYEFSYRINLIDAYYDSDPNYKTEIKMLVAKHL